MALFRKRHAGNALPQGIESMLADKGRFEFLGEEASGIGVLDSLKAHDALSGRLYGPGGESR